MALRTREIARWRQELCEWLDTTGLEYAYRLPRPQVLGELDFAATERPAPRRGVPVSVPITRAGCQDLNT